MLAKQTGIQASAAHVDVWACTPMYAYIRPCRYLEMAKSFIRPFVVDFSEHLGLRFMRWPLNDEG